MKKIDDTYKNNSLNKNLNFSKNCINNKCSFINNGIKNYLIKSTSTTNKEKNLNDYFSLRNKKKYSKLKNIWNFPIKILINIFIIFIYKYFQF